MTILSLTKLSHTIKLHNNQCLGYMLDESMHGRGLQTGGQEGMQQLIGWEYKEY
jgi:hypothetical protein